MVPSYGGLGFMFRHTAEEKRSGQWSQATTMLLTEACRCTEVSYPCESAGNFPPPVACCVLFHQA